MSAGKDIVDGQIYLDHLSRLKGKEVKRPTWGEREHCKAMPDLPFPFGCFGLVVSTGGVRGADALA